jgi:hypothetical protein
MNILNFTKTIQNIQKLDKELRANVTTKPTYSHLFIKGSNLEIHFSQNCTQAVIDATSSVVNNFVEISLKDTLKAYMETKVTPFIEDMLYEIQAENIEMGITQLGKTAEVVGFFAAQVTIPGVTRPISFKDTIDTKSLTVTIQILDYYLANPSEYSDLSPFITTERLTNWKAKIVNFLT